MDSAQRPHVGLDPQAADFTPASSGNIANTPSTVGSYAQAVTSVGPTHSSSEPIPVSVRHAPELAAIGLAENLVFAHQLRVGHEGFELVRRYIEQSTQVSLRTASGTTEKEEGVLFPQNPAFARHQNRMSRPVSGQIAENILNAGLSRRLRASDLAGIMSPPKNETTTPTQGNARFRGQDTPGQAVGASGNRASMITTPVRFSPGMNPPSRLPYIPKEPAAMRGLRTNPKPGPRLAYTVGPARNNSGTKRRDQGPEPSAADIYPQDAQMSVTPFRGYHQHESAQASSSPSASALPVTPLSRPLTNPSAWPTPAEGLATIEACVTRQASILSLEALFSPQARDTLQVLPVPRAPPGFPSLQTLSGHHVPQSQPITFPTMQNAHVYIREHGSHTVADMRCTEFEALAYLNVISSSSGNILDQFSSFQAVPDESPLSPGQRYGSKYGMHLGGIGLGSEWSTGTSDWPDM